MNPVHSETRISFKNILFCTDFSGEAAVAFPYAVELARHFGARFHALHVRNPDNYIMVFPEGGSIPPGFTKKEAREKLNALLDPLSDLTHEALVEEGEVWPTVASVIQKNAIDLIVVGSKGRTGLAKLVIGSQAEQIFRAASCPVLILGPRSAHLPKGNGIQQILYATDFSEESLAAVPYAISLAQEYEAGLTLLHVIPPEQPRALVTAEQRMASSERIMRSAIPSDAESWCRPQYMVEQGEPAEKVLEVAALKHADLIVLGVRGPSGTGVAGAGVAHLPGATAYKIITQASCPVLTVRESVRSTD